MVRKKQVNVRLSDDDKKTLHETAAKYRTTVAELMRAYTEYLRDGGKPIGYPKEEK